MQDKHVAQIAAELSLAAAQVLAVAGLLEEGATVPFIARYRKEATGSLDEVAVTSIRDRMEALAELHKRREAIFKSLEERQLLTDDLRERLLGAGTMALLEDIYLPFRPKRRTRATVAREKGLEPLAELLFAQGPIDPAAEAAPFVDPEKGVESVEDALGGARDIIAEWVNENQGARAQLRELFSAKGLFRSKVSRGKETEGAKFRDYFDWEEPVKSAPSHRILAMRRGEKENVLSLSIAPPEEEALKLLEGLFVTGSGPASEEVRAAVHDGYRRLLSLSMETEIRLESKKRADEAAIRVFADNLRQLLLAPPLGQKNVLAVDPGFRTGCKVVCLDRQGKLLSTDTIHPHFSEEGKGVSAEKIRGLSERFGVEAIAIGNGTAGRETQAFIRAIDLSKEIQVIMVNESGASVYSASQAARDEFPDQDVTVRGAVSIGRRLMDPLAELVKIDPKAIGVGQYQHDVDPGSLKRSLDDVVTSCVNAVGVEVNTASPQLLTYVSGLGPQLAANIVTYRNEHGPFPSREALRKVPRLGPKAFEQAAGFLRIRDGENPLDASAVHPESYPVVDGMARDLGCSVTDLMKDEEKRGRIDIAKYVTEKVGIPTLKDILAELAKPGRDPRERFESVTFAEGVEKIEDLTPGMKLPGVVTNVTAFGAFVDIGVHQDGLVHISQLADRYVSDPNQVVKVQQKVQVTVLEVDFERRRIALSMKTGAKKEGGDPAAKTWPAKTPPGKPPAGKPPSGKSREDKKKAGPAPFNNPFARAFEKAKK